MPIQESEIIDFLRTTISERTRLPLAKIDNDADLSEMGLKSLDVVLLSGEIEDRFDIEIDPVMLFTHRSVHAVARHLMVTLGQK
jgi:acyl carrier protein